MDGFTFPGIDPGTSKVFLDLDFDGFLGFGSTVFKDRDLVGFFLGLGSWFFSSRPLCLF